MPSVHMSASIWLLMLQWVHRLVTVVMSAKQTAKPSQASLQWVHRLVTVVMKGHAANDDRQGMASMGPPSGNGGYGPLIALFSSLYRASMGPPSGNGGYAGQRSDRLCPAACFNGSTVW